MSVPALPGSATPTHRHQSEGVTSPLASRDLLNVCGRSDLSDRAKLVYVVLATVATGEVSLDAVCEATALRQQQANKALSELVRADLIAVRQRVVGYRDNGLRIRRRYYRLAGVTA